MGRPQGIKNKVKNIVSDVDTETWVRSTALWTVSRTTSSEIVKLDKVVKDIQILSARRRLTRQSLADAMARIECAIYAIKVDLKK